MILFNTFLDIIMPFNTYFVIYNLDRNSLFDVIVAGIILDIIYKKIIWNVLILVVLYLILKMLKIRRLKRNEINLFVYIIYFNVCLILFNFNYVNYVTSFFIGLVSYVIFIFIMNSKLFTRK